MTLGNALYDRKLASVYDRMYPIDHDTALAVDFIAGLAPAGGRILEVGIGTGRIAVPLAERGFRVHGIDGSEAMLAELRKRDPHGAVTTVLGDFTEEGTGLTFDVVTLVLNTFFVAVTKEQQLGCLRRVREQLAQGGRFVLEAFDPAPYHCMDKPDFSMRHLDEGAIMLDTLTVDRSQQLMLGTHTIIDGGPPETREHVLRYAFPFEIDLLAELSGLRLTDRFEDWTGTPYTASSLRHVSVYERDDA
ncbi:class I SAM-dependent methyltransferase [Streptomyces sp. WAC05374]|uniref:class I SAM-dependent methyltransferase n=1 Tax=Streptomyces sp. WAC05374 TaxID=2487420 RepID=UPI000F868790|nr:class I SAM-dependent methyltransferase [Streptomyces sp. WAC05374]RST05332.1 class I SAM-dependent methyltransferase [Streptomyces sp. WAC05374]TDF44676.1 class I SAM-dependent methyltransferase [Streptomyces sp. WAC05374]TDF56714.1 class I SAM-dependent methyltransferase [Streptomyces sp. WAC05374]TDF59910.1 class I SAM-dependent methyltransferase [Streptomyces sp. WAC05374]